MTSKSLHVCSVDAGCPSRSHQARPERLGVENDIVLGHSLPIERRSEHGRDRIRAGEGEGPALARQRAHDPAGSLGLLRGVSVRDGAGSAGTSRRESGTRRRSRRWLLSISGPRPHANYAMRRMPGAALPWSTRLRDSAGRRTIATPSFSPTDLRPDSVVGFRRRPLTVLKAFAAMVGAYCSLLVERSARSEFVWTLIDRRVLFLVSSDRLSGRHS
jgi:hypothetical protein